MIEPRTVALVVLISTAQCSLLFFSAAAVRHIAPRRGPKPALFWGIGALIQSLAFLGLLAPEGFSPWLRIVFPNVAIPFGQAIVLVGMRRLFERPQRLALTVAGMAAFAVIEALFTFVWPSIALRMVLNSAAIAVIYGDGAYLCFRARSESGALAWSVGAIFAAICLFFLGRAAATILAPPPDILASLPLNAATFMMAQVGLLFWSLGLILLQNRRIESDLERAVEEKAVLLRELQHRVKNSIAVISGLVGLESRREDQDELVSARLRGLQDRIAAIGSLYERLSRGVDSTQEVALDEYLASVARALFEGQAAAERGLALELALEPARIDAKRAVSIGLIANELVSDSLKHAFPEGRAGKVRLALEGCARERGRLLRLRISDDGIGLPEGSAERWNDGLGLQIVRMLTAQIGGSFEAASEGGARFSVSFPAEAID